MINLITQTLAVPYGYTNESSNMEDSDVQWQEDACNNNYRNFTSVRNGPLLPDLILDTPPPSPLRRAHSHHFIFPEKSFNRSFPQTTLPPTPTSSLPSSPFSLPPTPTSLPPTPSTADDIDNEVVAPPVSVKHIQAVRQRILSESETRIPAVNLPQLAWDVPLPSRVMRPQPETQFHLPETEEQRTRRNIGADLRKIADKFHLDHAIVQGKSSRFNTDSNLDIAVPIVLTHCIQVSLMAIFCWSLLNKFR